MSEEDKNKILFSSQEIQIAGDFIKINPYPWGKMNNIAQPLSKVLKSGIKQVKYINDLLYNLNHKNHEVFTYQLTIILNDIMEDAGDELIRLIQLSVNKPTNWIKALSLSDFANLVIVVYKVNEKFFKSLFDKKENAEYDNDSLGLDEILTVLIEYGHKYEDIMNQYTIDQIHIFIEGAFKRDMYKQGNEAEAVMLAIGGCFAKDDKKVLKIIDELKGKRGVNHGK